jgi:hypothetical protein
VLAEEHVLACTAAFFAQRSFADMTIIGQLHASLSHTLQWRVPRGTQSPDEAYLHCALDTRALVILFRRKLLQIFKCLLLGKKYA